MKVGDEVTHDYSLGLGIVAKVAQQKGSVVSDQQSNSSEDQQRKAFIAKMDDIAGFEMGLGEYEKGFGLVFDYIQANYLPLKQVEAAFKVLDNHRSRIYWGDGSPSDLDNTLSSVRAGFGLDKKKGQQ